MLRKGLCLVFAFMLIFALLPAVALAEEAGDDQQEQTETTTEQEGEDPNVEEGDDSGASFGFLQKLIERTQERIQRFGDKLETLPEQSHFGIERAMSNFQRQMERFQERQIMREDWTPGEGKPPWAGEDNDENGTDEEYANDENEENNGNQSENVKQGPPHKKDRGDWQPGDGKPPWAGGSDDDNGDDENEDE